MKKKLALDELKVSSFITSQIMIKGGDANECQTLEIVCPSDGSACVSEDIACPGGNSQNECPSQYIVCIEQ